MWSWRLGDSPAYCAKVCRPSFEAQGLGTPCVGCPKEPPDLLPCNLWVDQLYATFFPCRDGNGGLYWPLLLDAAKEEGFDASDREVLVSRVAAVEASIHERAIAKMKAESAKSSATPARRPTPRRGRR